MTKKCGKNPLKLVPNEINNGINKSFRDIAIELKKFKKTVLEQPLTKEYLIAPYSKTKEEIELVDRLWITLANQLVSDRNNLPDGYGKRITFCTNGGIVFIDTTTYIYNSPIWLNYSVIFGFMLNKESQLLLEGDVTFNPEELKLDNLKNTPVKQNINIRAGSTEPPNLDINNLKPQKNTPIKFEKLDNLLSRQEIVQAVSNKYGWSSRYSDTIYTTTWNVATNIVGNDGYKIYLRLSYFKL